MKSEKEKMLAGELYDASDLLLTQERQRARMLTHQLNATHYGDRCIVGAGAVVTKSIPADTIVVGNPAKPIGRKDA